MILICEMYKLWIDKYCMISIIKLSDVKFVIIMFYLSFKKMSTP